MIGQLLTLASLELRHMVGGAKLAVIALLMLGIAGLALVVRLLAPEQAQPFWPVIYVTMLNFVFLQTVVILVPLLLATSLIKNEIDQGTLVYLITRPIPRPLILLTKWLAVSGASVALVAVGMLTFQLAFLLPGDPSEGAFPYWERLGAFLQAGALGVIGYGALFCLVGLVFKRGLIWGIAYGFLSEFVLTNIPAMVKQLTLMHYLRSVALAGLSNESLAQGRDLGDDGPELLGFLDLAAADSATGIVLVVAAGCLVVATLAVSRLELSGSSQEAD